VEAQEQGHWTSNANYEMGPGMGNWTSNAMREMRANYVSYENYEIGAEPTFWKESR
jgi:hypothetical protein